MEMEAMVEDELVSLLVKLFDDQYNNLNTFLFNTWLKEQIEGEGKGLNWKG